MNIRMAAAGKINDPSRPSLTANVLGRLYET